MFEFLGGSETSLNIQLVGHIGIAAFSAQCACGGLNVLGLHGAAYVAGGNAQTSHAQRIHPDAHGVFLLCHHFGGGDTLLSGQCVLDGIVDVVDQLIEAQAGAIRPKGQHGQDVAAAFFHGHTGLGDFAGQLRLGALYGILQIDQGNVGISAGLKGNRTGVAARIAAGGGKVEQAFHPVDLVFQRHGHGLGHHVGAGPGIGGGHMQGGRRYFGIFRHGQAGKGNGPGQRKHKTDHSGQTGPPDEEA